MTTTEGKNKESYLLLVLFKERSCNLVYVWYSSTSSTTIVESYIEQKWEPVGYIPQI